MRQRRVIFAPEALGDLLALYEWVMEASSPSVAIGFVDRLETACLSMDTASERGHRRDDVRKGLRVVGFERRVTIAFAVDDEQVTILRLFRAGRDWERVLD